MKSIYNTRIFLTGINYENGAIYTVAVLFNNCNLKIIVVLVKESVDYIKTLCWNSPDQIQEITHFFGTYATNCKQHCVPRLPGVVK